MTAGLTAVGGGNALASGRRFASVGRVDASRPSFGEAARFWAKLGVISFGGPAGQIAVMHTELVEKKKWLGEQQFLHALNFCMLLPGPEATQLAIYSGWLLHRARGGIVAGGLFVLPAAVLLWALSYVYVVHGHVPWIAAIFYGLKPAVTAIVATAAIRIGRRALKGWVKWAIAAVAFAGIYFWRVPFPTIVVGAAAVGWAGARWRHGPQAGFAGEEKFQSPTGTPDSTLGRAVQVIAIGLVLWFAPLLVAGEVLGWDHAVVREGIFFSKAAMVTFGGAYAVLPYVAQQAVDVHGWLGASQMLEGLGLAETTPGPLIMVLQFVGFLGAWRFPGELNPLLAATLGAAMTTWATFVPCFLWIFLGAPYVERARGKARLEGALAAVTAAVVGVVLNLAVWFGWQTFVPPGGRGVDWFAVAVALAAFAAMHRWKVGVVAVVLTCGFAGWWWKGFLLL